MRKIVLKFGLVAGAMLSAVLFATTTLFGHINLDYGAVVGYTSMVLAFMMVYFGVRSYRDTVAGGKVGFGKAAWVGLLIMVIASACYVASWEIIYFKFAPDFMDVYAAHVLEKARTSGATDAALAAQAQQMAQFKESYQNPLFNIAITFLEPLPVGLLFVFVSAFLLSRGRKEEPGTGTPAMTTVR